MPHKKNAVPAETGNGALFKPQMSNYQKLAEIATGPQWVTWRSIDGRKVPFDPKTGKAASSTSPATWGTLSQAHKRAAGRGDGIGLVLGPIQGRDSVCIGGIDLDTCRDPATGKLAPWANEIIEHLQTYCEVSPSGTGVKLFFLHTTPEAKAATFKQRGTKHPPGIELYFAGRYFAVTNEAIQDPLLGEAFPVRSLPASDLTWLVEVAGPKLTGKTSEQPQAQDDSSSGAAFRKAIQLQLNGEDIEAFSDWASDHPWGDFEKNPERAVERTWERASLEAGKKALAERNAGSVFDDLGVDEVKPRKSTLTGFDLTSLEQEAADSFEIIEDLLPVDSLSCVYGPPSAGKTFFEIDMGLHIAAGRKWNGRGIEKSGVIYVALEGAKRFRNRLRAWCKHQGCEVDSLPFHYMVGSLDLRNDKATRQDIIDTANRKQSEWGIPVRLIVIDTLARAMAGGDENSAQDMGSAVAAMDAIRIATGAHVSIVHHTGKDSSKGARGSNALLGAVDTEISVSRDGDIRLSEITKQKDGKEGPLCSFGLEVVEVGRSKQFDKKAITSCVVVSGVVGEFEDLDELSERERTAFNILKGEIKKSENGDKVSEIDFRKALNVHMWPEKDMKASARSTAVKRVIESLAQKDKILIENGYLKQFT